MTSSMLESTARERAADQLDTATVFGLLDDEDARAILGALHEPRTARELMAACDIPRSTTYRKLDELADAGLVTRRIRPCRSGNHASEYARTVDGVHVDLSADGVRVDGEHRRR